MSPNGGFFQYSFNFKADVDDFDSWHTILAAQHEHALTHLTGGAHWGLGFVGSIGFAMLQAFTFSSDFYLVICDRAGQSRVNGPGVSKGVKYVSCSSFPVWCKDLFHDFRFVACRSFIGFEKNLIPAVLHTGHRGFQFYSKFSFMELKVPMEQPSSFWTTMCLSLC